LTLCYFFILLILAYGADRYNDSKQSKKVSEQNAKSNEIKLKKATLREISRKQGELTVLEIAQGLKTSNTRGVNEIEQNQIRELYKEILEVNELSKVRVDALMKVL